MTQSNPENRTEREPPKPSDEREPRTIASAELFRGAREIWIDHEGMRYHLRITRRNKLILNR